MAQATHPPKTARTLGICRVRTHRVVAANTVVLGIEASLAAPPRAGQFAMVHPLRAGCLLARPFSILDYIPHDHGAGAFADAAGGTLEILVKVVGKGTRALAELAPGDPVRVLAPLGRSFDDPELRESRLVLIAGGVGIVPLHLLARELRAEGREPPLAHFGARTPDDIPRSLFSGAQGFWQLWVESIRSSSGATPSPQPPQPPQTGSGAPGSPHSSDLAEVMDAGLRTGLVTAGLQETLDAHPDAVVATCGPTPMMRAVAGICRARRARLWLCLEEQMGCGANVCRACVVPDAHAPRMRTVCTEGPVFRLEEIVYG